jgi:hypothetical protein
MFGMSQKVSSLCRAVFYWNRPIGGLDMSRNTINVVMGLFFAAILGMVGCGDDGTTDPTATQQTVVANAGSPQTVTTGTVVTLDGSASTVASGKTASYSWAITSAPVGSAASITNPTAAKPQFTPDVAGTYIFTLTVSDGSSNAIDNVTVTVTPTPTLATQLATQLETSIVAVADATTVEEQAVALQNFKTAVTTIGNDLVPGDGSKAKFTLTEFSNDLASVCLNDYSKHPDEITQAFPADAPLIVQINNSADPTQQAYLTKQLEADMKADMKTMLVNNGTLTQAQVDSLK